MSKNQKEKTSAEYNNAAHSLLGEIVQLRTTMDDATLVNSLHRLMDLAKLAGMADIVERANGSFNFEANLVAKRGT